MSSQKRKAEGDNAFERLMQASTKKQRSRFVLCPVGCGTQVPEIKINEHLDLCFQRSPLDSPHGIVLQSTKEGVLNEDQLKTNSIVYLVERLPSSQEIPSKVQGATNKSTQINSFSQMMRESKRVFSASDSPSQRFHLHDDFTLTWTTLSTKMVPPGIIWTSLVQLKQEKSMLILSTSIVPDDRPLLVKKHSRLSVPVLKSMLQKAVRRRRPLPATRTAMELTDKYIGALLRRLPIILLEDSTLHPDFPLLVWLMVAESKGYKIPLALISKVLQIVHEMASCQWTDYIASTSDERDNLKEEFAVVGQVPSQCDTMVKSIHLRALFGGMACDVKMLKVYKQLWEHRFRDERLVPRAVLEQIGSHEILDWKDLPLKIYERAKLHSEIPVLNLVQEGLASLKLEDLCIEGVDFHCSPILDQIMTNSSMFEDCIKYLKNRIPGIPIHDNKREWLIGILKQCMWKFSSGVNHRRPLLSNTMVTEEDANLKIFWREKISVKVTEYMRKYVKDRLAR